MTSRGERTRQHLLDVAEDLFGRQGVDNVSLREIRLAAGQRNAAAVQYHFGDRDGVLTALAERHLPRIEARHQELLRVARSTPDEPRAWVTVLLLPYIEYVELGPSERSWVRICADLQSRPTLARLNAHVPESAQEAGFVLYERVKAIVPDDLAVERLLSASQAGIHTCADRARSLAEQTGRTLLPAERFSANLLDMATAAILAPATTLAEPGPDKARRRPARQPG